MFAASGCAPPEQPKIEETLSLDTTVGQLGRLYQYSAVGVMGYGIVAGLPGTGSSECPPELRNALTKHIQTSTGRDTVVNPNRFINSKYHRLFGTDFKYRRRLLHRKGFCHKSRPGPDLVADRVDRPVLQA